MDRLKETAVVLHMARLLRERESWCGETHIQKAMYFAQQAMGVDTDFEYIFYKHGPFSFDLRGFIEGLRADNLLRLEPQERPYGPRFAVTPSADKYRDRFPKTMAKYGDKLEKVAEFFSDKGVAELERLSSALFVTKEEAVNGDMDTRVREILELKPHVDEASARSAIQAVDEFLAEVGSAPA